MVATEDVGSYPAAVADPDALGRALAVLPEDRRGAVVGELVRAEEIRAVLEEVSAVCTRAIIIARGHLIVDATPSELEGTGQSLEAFFRDLTLNIPASGF